MRRLLLALVVVATGYWFLAPAAIGGSTSYLLTEQSMVSGVPDGALVVVRQRDDYAAGDVVAYRNGPSGEVDVRRVVAVDGDRYLVSGDHASRAEGYRPAGADLLGTRWVVVPGVGHVLSSVWAPVAGLALLALLAFLLVESSGRRDHGRPTVSRPTPRHP